MKLRERWSKVGSASNVQTILATRANLQGEPFRNGFAETAFQTFQSDR